MAFSTVNLRKKTPNVDISSGLEKTVGLKADLGHHRERGNGSTYKKISKEAATGGKIHVVLTRLMAIVSDTVVT